MSMTAIMFITFFVLIFLTVPIGWALGISAVFAMVATGARDFSLVLLASRIYNSTNSFVLMALPFFILAGNIMSCGGLSKRLINFCRSLIGRVHGGLGMTGIMAASFFAAISGSNAATTAAVGGMMIPELEKNGYPRDLSAATIAAAGTTGMVIPPSAAMVVYAATASASLPALFMGGLVPGILMAVSLMICTYVIARKMKIERDKTGPRHIRKNLLKAIPALMMPIIILGGIYSGVFTATEAAVVACVYSLIITVFVFKELKLRDLPKIFWESAITSAVGMIVITCASMLGYVLTKEHIPEMLSKLFLSWTDSKVIILLLFNIVLLFAGCFMTPNSAIVILVPIFLPVLVSFGIDPVAIGVVMVLNLSIGAITPPVGGNVFVASSIAKVKVELIFKRVMIFLAVLLVDLIIINCFNDIVLFLPRLLGKY